MGERGARRELREDEVAGFALELVRTASPSGQEGAVAGLVGREMDRLGYEVEVDGLGNVLGTLRLGPGPTVLLDSHMDTVGVTDASAWSRDPRGEVVDGRLFGRGAMDMKGPLAAAVHGVAALRGEGRGTVVVCASVAEELVEGVALARVAERVRPDRVVICEATGLRVAHGQRGRAEIRLEVRGRPTHSSRPEHGVNAVDAMVGVLAPLRELPMPGPHRGLGAAILVTTDIASRPYPALSVVPDYCVATLDRRTLPGERAEDVLAPVRAAAEAALDGTGAEVRAAIAEDDFATYTGERVVAPNFAPAWYRDASDPIVRAALAALAEAGLPARRTTYAFCTNGSGTLGIDTIGYGPGEEELAHRVDEHVPLADLAAAARGYAAIVHTLCR
jgi:putative selenium metabolism hydrolase